MKTIVITGANGGIGLELVKKYLKKGARVYATDICLDNLLPLESSLLILRKLDVRSTKSFKALSNELRHNAHFPEVWINNAGVARPEHFEELGLESFEDIFSINFSGVLKGTYAALELMQPPHIGSIVNVSSMNGLIPAPFMSAYSASKHAVVGLTRSLQLEFEFQQKGPHLMLVCPGFAKTAIMDQDKAKTPPWMDRFISSPSSVADEIIKGVESHKKEIYPGISGKFLALIGRPFAMQTGRSSRAILGKNWKEAIGLSAINLKEHN